MNLEDLMIGRPERAVVAAWMSMSLTASAVSKTGECGMSLYLAVDLFPDGVHVLLLIREEVREDVIGGFADNHVSRDQDCPAAEAVGPHLRTGERRDHGDVAERG